MGREGDLPSCTLSKAVAINFLREALTSRQMRVEIYKPALAGNSKRENWEIDAAASPGNLEDVEELLFGDNIQISDAPMCLAVTFRIKEGIKTVGIAYADAVDRKIGLSEFAETDIWSNTEVLNISHDSALCSFFCRSLSSFNSVSKKLFTQQTTRVTRLRGSNYANLSTGVASSMQKGPSVSDCDAVCCTRR